MTATINRQTPGTVGVVGLGYTGLPLALSLAGAGLLTIGLDIDRDKISALRKGRSYLPDVGDDELAATADWFEPTGDAARLAGLDAYVICVPTPTAAGGVANLSYVDVATDMVAPLAGGSGLVPGVDFQVPDEIRPGEEPVPAVVALDRQAHLQVQGAGQVQGLLPLIEVKC